MAVSKGDPGRDETGFSKVEDGIKKRSTDRLRSWSDIIAMKDVEISEEEEERQQYKLVSIKLITNSARFNRCFQPSLHTVRRLQATLLLAIRLNIRITSRDLRN